jgi:tetratricopeptide (TPR) repeat protein
MTPDAKSNAPDDLTRLRRSPEAEAFWQNAQRYLVNGHYAHAVAGYQNLIQNFPNISQLWAEFGLAAAGALDFSMADQASLRAVELAGKDVNLLVSLGQQYHRLRRLEQACACFERAAESDPASVHAKLSLAAWYERDRRLDDAWNCVEACLAQHSKDTRALYFKAFLLHRKGQDSDAETILRDILKLSPLEPNLEISAKYLLAGVLDQASQYAEALTWLGKAKQQVRAMADTPALEKAYDQVDRDRRKLLDELTPDNIRRWKEEAAESPSSHPMALLGGVPRSGTTLIEQVLGGHSDISIFDEPEAFAQEVLKHLQPAPPAKALNLKTLNSLAAPPRNQLIARYTRNLLHGTEPPPSNRLLLDKNPSLTPSLHIWLRLFPQSKIIIALRDPRDLIVSCYFQNLTLTATNVNFLGIERTMKFYSDCMDVWLRLRELGGFDSIETKYEDVVTDLPKEGKRLMNFLGLPWNDAQARYHDAKQRQFVHAPTYSDVAKPVYNRAVGRWKNYAEALAPIQPRLTKYCQTFGYP